MARPNMLFAIVKYQEETKNFWKVEPSLRLKNAVFRSMKDAIGDYVCDYGIKELATLRKKVYEGFRRKTQYVDFCNEIHIKYPKMSIVKK